MAVLLPITLEDAANKVLLPLAGVLVGLCFAWGGNAQTLLQSDEILLMTDQNKGGFRRYAFVYQSAVLLLMVTLVLWGLAGLGLFDQVWPRASMRQAYVAAKCLLYFFVSVSIRECWHVVLGTQYLAFARVQILAKRAKSSDTTATQISPAPAKQAVAPPRH
jgi:hypothetical protein